MKKGGAYYLLTMLKYATGRNANVIKTLLDLRDVNRSGVEDEAEQAEDTDLEEEEVENSECYDCAWLSLTALSTVTRNLWL
jgi:hypothetical protein